MEFCDKEGPKAQDLWLSQFMLIVEENAEQMAETEDKSKTLAILLRSRESSAAPAPFSPSHALRRPESLIGKCDHENIALEGKEGRVTLPWIMDSDAVRVGATFCLVLHHSNRYPRRADFQQRCVEVHQDTGS